MGIYIGFYLNLTFGILTQPQHGMQRLKTLATKYFLQKPGGTQKLDITHNKMYNNR